MRRAASLAFALALTLAPAAVPAQTTDTLADIRQELGVLFVELQRLKRELSTTGNTGAVIQGDVLQRADLIEAELRRLTAKTEELEFRIDTVVQDGTNRIGDLEFRLCELEPDCDIGSLGETPTLGGAVGTPAVVPAPPPQTGDSGGQLAIGEQADFDRARAAFDAGDFAAAADQFRVFTETYMGGPLTGAAHYWRGRALEGQGQVAPAARAYLDSFSGTPDGAEAPDALFRLGLALEALGQRNEACVTLGEVPARYPGSGAAAEATVARSRLTCP